jgi:3-oxoacyl-[acyl-carrier protein] reductase
LALRYRERWLRPGRPSPINYRERADEANKLAENLRKTGVNVITVQADVSLANAISKMVDTAKSELGTIDILINNAGIAITGGIDDLSEADFDQTIATNLKSVFLCTQAVLPMMRAKKWERIVNISSGAARGAGFDRTPLQCIEGRR